MADEKKALNLDELFGQARAVKVIWQGRTYELARMESMGPKEGVQFQKLHAKVAGLQNIGENEVSGEQAEQVEEALDEMLTLLCANLPIGTLTFRQKMRVMEYYIAETQEKKASDLALKKVKAPRTGARSSRR